MPSHAAWAPRASTAATPRASPIPPAAITGTGATASTTAGTSGRVATVTPHVAAGFPALRDDHVHPRRDGPPCFLGRADRVQDNAPGVVDLLDVAAGIAHKKRDDSQAGLQGLVKTVVLVFGEHEVAAKRPCGERRRLPDHGSDVG